MLTTVAIESLRRVFRNFQYCIDRTLLLLKTLAWTLDELRSETEELTDVGFDLLTINDVGQDDCSSCPILAGTDWV